jgi:3-phosphoshikimate 1-carboxyvinyltransferase
MALPDLIEVVPLAHPVPVSVRVPGSKSITNRALVLAALAGGQTTLEGALWSEDTQVMVDGLRRLGFEIAVEPDPDEFCNRTIIVHGQGGRIPQGGTAREPLELFVGNAGTAARFLAALVCLGQGVYRLHGVHRMHDRPQAALFQALRQLGYRIDSPNDRLPAFIHAHGRHYGHCHVSIAESSQFASALLLCAAKAGWTVEITGENPEESPYVAMTTQMVESFPAYGGEFRIEPDASSGSYFWAAGWLALGCPASAALGPRTEASLAGNGPLPDAPPGLAFPPLITVGRWPSSGWQVDEQFPRFLPLPKMISRQGDLGDSIMTAIAIAPCADHPVHFVDLGRLRLQECERVEALRTELTRCGAKVVEWKDTLEVFPSERMHGAEIETYQDHRMAMCFATLGLKVPGVKIREPVCVKKTFPNFFQKLAAPPPEGLGATLLDGATGRPLSDQELFAD